MIDFKKYNDELEQIILHLNSCVNNVLQNRNEETENELQSAEYIYDNFLNQYAEQCLTTLGVEKNHPKAITLISLAQDYCSVFKKSYLQNLYVCLRDLVQLI